MPIFDTTHADLVVAHIGERSDVQPIFGLMPQKIAVVHFSDSNTCLAKFKAGRPFPAEFILLDTTNCVEESERFLVDFRSDSAFKKIPVVVLVDSDDDETSQKYGDLGANSILAKQDVLADQGNLSQIITDYWMSG
ncbi:MAG: hypothetical protein V7703_06570 [Hyphomicrobiales bacterium]